MRRPTFRLSYANVTSTLALVMATSGGAYAVTTLAPNSVGTTQLKTGAVTTPKIAPGAVTSGKVLNGSLQLNDFATGQLLRWSGDWSAGTAYTRMDVVADGGSTFVAIAASTGTPTSDPAAWRPFAAAGEPGTPGDPGTPGEPGTPGGRGPSYGDTVKIGTLEIDECGITDLATLPLSLSEPSRILGLASGTWGVSAPPPSYFVNQSRWVQVVDGDGSVVAQAQVRSSSVTNGGLKGADLDISQIVAGGSGPEVPAGDYTVRLRVLTTADTCPSSLVTLASEVQLSYVIVGTTP